MKTLRGERTDLRRATTWRPVTEDCRVRHVVGPTLVDVAHQPFQLDIVLVLEGTCVLRAHDGGRTQLPRATLALDLDRGIVEVPDGARVGLATFRSLVAAPRIREASPQLPPISTVDPGLCRAVEHFLGSLLITPPQGSLARHLVDRTVRDLFGALILDGRLRPPTSKDDSLYGTARNHIVDHCADPKLNATGVARAFGISPRQLARSFAEHGTTVSRTIADTRVLIAAALLAQTPETSVAEVCRSSGFPSQQAMRRAFTASGMDSPSRVRAIAAERHRAAEQAPRRDA